MSTEFEPSLALKNGSTSKANLSHKRRELARLETEVARLKEDILPQGRVAGF